MLDKLKSLLWSRRHTAGAGSPSTKKREINITIGLDFGTASTKCVVNLERYANGRDKFLAMTFPSKAYPQGIFCVPTSIGVQRNRLVFGEEAEELPEDKVIRSVKMAIPCVNTTWGDYRSPFRVTKRPGYFRIGKHDLSAVDLAMLYLSNTIRRIKVRLKEYVPGDVNIKRFLNLAAPLDQLIDISGKIPNVHNMPASENATRDTSISRHYMELGQRCLLMGDLSQDPWELEDAVATVERIKRRALRPFEESPTYVVPETLAAIIGYIRRPGTQSGRFMTLDVGAGTTDVSAFWLEKRRGKMQPWYYASASLHTGMDAIDWSLRDIAQAKAGSSIRQRREALQRQLGGLMACREFCDHTLKQIDKHRRRVFGYAYDKERKQGIWGDPSRANLTLILIGGGAQTDLIREMACQQLWENVIGGATLEIIGPLVTNALLPDGKECPLQTMGDLSDQIQLLTIADGLANKIIDIPPFDACNESLIMPRPIPPDDRMFDHWW